MVVCLLSLGRGRFELYAEPPEEPLVAPGHTAGRLRRWAHAANVRWRELVDAARDGGAAGRLARWRDRIVCHLAESIAEQRTLWVLKDAPSATLLYPSTMPQEQARTVLNQRLADARRHHGGWLIVDLLLLVASGVLMPIPGPNFISYYLAFRVVGHLQSWRGARRGSWATAWTLTADPSLAELASLVELPREVRQVRVEEIATRLNLHRLATFFERVAV